MRLSRLPVRLRLVVGFVGAMIVVLIAAGAFVFWRVEYALDHRLDEDLISQTNDLRQAATHQTPTAALRSLRDQARESQLLAADGTVLASGSGIVDGRPLLTPGQVRRAPASEVRATRGDLFSPHGQHVRILAVPVRGAGPAAVAVSAVPLDQRDEALRELLGQLTIANLLALAFASFVGYRLAHAALDPVERYRTQAQQITQGATGVRLDVPAGPNDEISRLGSTLNAMLDAQQRSAERQQQFIDDASHELRTPLSTLSAEIDLALRKPRTVEEYEATLGRVALSTDKLVELAETTEAAVSAAGRASEHLTAQMAGLARATRQVEEQIEAGRAVGNLVDNAVRYGAGTITLTGARLDTPQAPVVILSVSDEGSGISHASLEHAAERFWQDETSRSGAGAGLGLSLVDAIVTAHGGQLRICSLGHHHHEATAHLELDCIACGHPETGTTVSLLLPAVPESPAHGR